MKTAIILALLLAITTGSYASDPYRLHLDKRMDKCITAYTVMDSQGRIIASHNGSAPMIPASLTKLLTTAAALEALGPEFRYSTDICYSGEIRDGILEGDLYICGSGDPSLAPDRQSCDTLFAGWLRAIRSAGIDSIGGRIIGDDRIFSADNTPDTWQWSDLGTYYGSGAYGLNFGGNSIFFRIYPSEKAGDDASWTAVWPDTPWLSTESYVLTRPSGRSYIGTYAAPGVPELEIRGEIAMDRKYINTYAANRFPALTCAWMFGEYLRSNGIHTGKGMLSTDSIYGIRFAVRDSLTTLYTSYSAPLHKLIREMNRSSDNLYAEALLRTVGLMERGSSSYASSTGAVRSILARTGIDSTSYIICDGSGLSRNNHISPDTFCRFLKNISDNENFGTFLSSLPYPGGEGTLENILNDTGKEQKKRIRAKSGSMTGVKCYAGYVLSDNPDKTLVFTVMVCNNVRKNAAVQPAIEEFLKSLL